MPHSLAIVPAAGRSERFGSLKLVVDIDGEPLLNHTLRSLLDGGIAGVVVVVAPGVSLPSVTLLGDHRFRIVTNPDPSRGMFSSIQSGLAAATGDPILVLPADMPFVRPATVAALVTACVQAHSAVVPVHAGRRGHPVAMPGRLRDPLLSAEATASLKDALALLGVSPQAIAVEDPGVVRDVDRKEDLDASVG
jgi:molybdenum cofactor cytidylyltransferase